MKIGKKYRFVWGKKIMAIDDVKKGKTHDEPKVSNFRVYYEPIKKYTTWPGGESGWAKHRVWLEPSKETDTFGRGGFSIHGGDVPGSAGCIDLTSGMPGFAEWFKNNGKDFIIKVEY